MLEGLQITGDHAAVETASRPHLPRLVPAENGFTPAAPVQVTDTGVDRSVLLDLTGEGSTATKTFRVSGGSLTSNGVLICNSVPKGNTTHPAPTGKIDLAAGSTVNLTPPSSATWQGLNLFQERTSTTLVTLSGGSIPTISGMIYAAGMPLDDTGGSDTYSGSAFLVVSMSPSRTTAGMGLME